MTQDGKLTYWDLINGHALKKGDKIIIHGWLGQVDHTGGGEGYYLSIPGVRNSAIFSHLNIRTEDIYDFYPKGCLRVGDFPEYDSLENLKNCLIKLYETPFFKVGDTVRIKRKDAEGIKYPYCFDTPMAALEGQEFTVVQTINDTSNDYANRLFFNGDIQRYHLGGAAAGWTWHKSMLNLVKRASVQPEQHNKRAERVEQEMALEDVNVVDDKYEEIRLKDPVTKSKFHIKV